MFPMKKKEGPDRSIQEMWVDYCNLLIATGRPGVKRLLNWMQSDMTNGTLNFVNAPASTRYHGAYPGGLVEHSLNVYTRLCWLVSEENRMQEESQKLTAEESAQALNSCAIVALLHDLCKCGFYTLEWRNQKVYSDNGSKEDQGGRFDWQSCPCYKVKDTHLFGHGAASLEIAQRFLGVNGLTEEERYAIRYHMGNFENERETSEVYNHYPLATLLHLADLSATYLDERSCGNEIDSFWANLNSFARPKDRGTSCTQKE